MASDAYANMDSATKAALEDLKTDALEERASLHEDVDYRCEREARTWMHHSFPGSKIFENRTQNLAAMLKRFYEYGLSDAARDGK